MKPLFAAALAATALLAACDRAPQPRTTTPPSASSGASGPSAPVQPMPQTGAPSAAEKKAGANPVQGQVDPKEPAQRKDFKQ